MNKLKVLLLSVLFIVIAAVPLVNAQALNSLIEEAVKNNPKLKALESKTRAAEFKAESVNSYPAPTVGLEFSGIPFGKFNIFNDAFGNQLSVSQMFMLGGKVEAMTEAEKKSAVVTGDNYDVYKVNLIGQIKMAYYNLWLVERKIEIQKKNIELYNDLINYLNANFSVNRGNQADILTLRGEIASSQTQLVILERQIEAENYKLDKLIGRDLSSTGIKPSRDITSNSLKFSMNELEEKLSQINPALKQMNSMVEMNKAMITANEKDKIPDLMLQFMVMRQPQGMYLTSKTDLTMLGTEDSKTEYMYSLMASINLPFAPWAANKFKAREEELAAGIKGIEYEKNDMQREMVSQLKASVVKYKTSEDLLKLYSGNVIPLYEQAAQAQLNAYQNNKTSISSILDTYRMLLMQQMNYFMAQADSQMSLAEIEMMVGSSKQLFKQ